MSTQTLMNTCNSHPRNQHLSSPYPTTTLAQALSTSMTPSLLPSSTVSMLWHFTSPSHLPRSCAAPTEHTTAIVKPSFPELSKHVYFTLCVHPTVRKWPVEHLPICDSLSIHRLEVHWLRMWTCREPTISTAHLRILSSSISRIVMLVGPLCC